MMRPVLCTMILATGVLSQPDTTPCDNNAACEPPRQAPEVETPISLYCPSIAYFARRSRQHTGLGELAGSPRPFAPEERRFCLDEARGVEIAPAGIGVWLIWI